LKHSTTYTFKVRAVGPGPADSAPKSSWSAPFSVSTLWVKSKGDGLSNMSNNVGSWRKQNNDAVRAAEKQGVCNACTVQ